MTGTGCRLSREMKILPSMCDSAMRLSIPAALDIFQDTATLHADRFDIGPGGMERRNYFWIITKIRIHINRMPLMMDDVTACTWIQSPDRVSCERDFSITQENDVLAYGRSIWAVISRDTGRLVHMDGLYPEIDFSVAPPDDRSFLRINRKFDDAAAIGEYTVRSGDIDLGGHMNNVNYVRAMLGCFPSGELASMAIKELELNFISQTYEGETLRFVRRAAKAAGASGANSAAKTAGASDAAAAEIAAIGSDGKTVFTAAVLS